MNKNSNNIGELIRMFPDIIFRIRAGDLHAFATQLIAETRIEAEKERVNEERLLTPEQVSNMLQVSDTTLWRLEKDGILHPVLVRGQKRYRFFEIMSIIKR